jgi:hypothetical protein
MIDAELARLEKLLAPGGPEPAAPPSGPELCLTRSELRSICGTRDDAFNARLLDDTIAACSPADDPGSAAAEVIAALRDMAPVGSREAMLAAQVIVTCHAALDSHRRAQAAPGPLQVVHREQASRLSRTHAALSEALERLRSRDSGPRVRVIEHRYVKSA